MNDNVATWDYSDCRGCRWLHRIKAQDGFSFHGCEHKPYKGKMVSEIEKCPCTQEEYEKRRLRTGRGI